MGVTGLTVKLLVLIWVMAVQFDSAHGVNKCYACDPTVKDVNARNGISARYGQSYRDCKDFKTDTKHNFEWNCGKEEPYVCFGGKDGAGSYCIQRRLAGGGLAPAVGKCNDIGCTCDAELCNKSIPLVGPSRCMVMFLGACYFFWGLYSWGQTLI